jgi:hypothetical protein
MLWAVNGTKLAEDLGPISGAVTDLTFVDNPELHVNMDGRALDGSSTFVTLNLTDVDNRAPSRVLAGVLDVEPKTDDAEPSAYPVLVDRVRFRRSGLVTLGGVAISGKDRLANPTCSALRRIIRDCYQNGLPSFT